MDGLILIRGAAPKERVLLSSMETRILERRPAVATVAVLRQPGKSVFTRRRAPSLFAAGWSL